MKLIQYTLLSIIFTLGACSNSSTPANNNNLSPSKNQINLESTNGGIKVFQTDSKNGVTVKSIITSLENSGFSLAKHTNLNHHFETKYHHTYFNSYDLITVYHAEKMDKIVKKYPKMGVFVPTTIAFYHRKGASNIQVAVLPPTEMAFIAGADAKDKDIIDLEKITLKAVIAAMPNVSTFNLGYTPDINSDHPLITTYEKTLSGYDLEEEVDEVEEEFEDGLEAIKFSMPLFTDFNVIMNQTSPSPFDVAHMYSLCKLVVIYTVSETHPEAGVFAPCTMAVMKQKDSEELSFSFPNVYNWMRILNISDNQEYVSVLMKAQTDMEGLLQSITE